MMKVINLTLNSIISIINYIDLMVESAILNDKILLATVVIKVKDPYNK